MQQRCLPRLAWAALALLTLSACAHSGQGHAISHHGAMPHRFEDADAWAREFEDPARDAWQKPEEVIAALALPPEAKVADLSSATGYFAVRLARAVPKGRVYGVDIEPDMKRYLAERAQREGLGNLTAVLGEPADPKLPEPVDLMLVVNTYHHIQERTAYFRRLLGSLALGGRVAIVDFRKGQPMGPPEQHRLTPEQVRRELEAAGYKLTEELSFLPNQYFLIFARADASASGDRAFLWEVKEAQGQGGTVYVVGSIHLARTGELTLPPSMEAAFRRSEVLVVEVDVGALDALKSQKLILELGMLPAGQRLSQRLDPETVKLLEAAARRTGLPMAGLERMRPWVAAVTLSVLELQRSGYESGLGVDRVFLDRARGTREIVELETAEEQLRLLASLPEPLQDQMLRDQLRRSEQPEGGLERITEAWKAGDADAMAAQVFQEETSDSLMRPLYEKLFFERNARMAEKIRGMLAQPRTWFVVVGAGHVVGPEGLLERLRKLGYTVRQLPRES